MWRIQYYRYRILRYLHRKMDDDIASGAHHTYDDVLRSWVHRCLLYVLVVAYVVWLVYYFGKGATS